MTEYQFRDLGPEAISRDGLFTDFNPVDPNGLYQVTELLDFITTKTKISDILIALRMLVEKTYQANADAGKTDLEVIRARGYYASLSEHLTHIKNDMANLDKGSPRGVYGSLAQLQSSIPNGNNYTYITQDDGKWNYYDFSTKTWKPGGAYQQPVFQSGSISQTALKPSSMFARITSPVRIDFPAKTITFIAGYAYWGTSVKAYQQQTFTLPKEEGYIAFGVNDGKFYLVAPSSPMDYTRENQVVVGYINGRQKINIFCDTEVVSSHGNGLVNTMKSDYQKGSFYESRVATIFGTNLSRIDATTDEASANITQLKLSGNFIVYGAVSEAKMIADKVVDVSATLNKNGGGAILYDVSSGNLRAVMPFDVQKSRPSEYVLGYWWMAPIHIQLCANSNIPVYLNGDVQNAGSQVNGEKVLFIGDSITEGQKPGATFGIYSHPFPHYVMQAYGGAYDNIGKSGAQIVGSRTIDFTAQSNLKNLSGYGVAIIALGVNDYLFNSNIETVKTNLRNGINKMYRDNTSLRVVGVLPHNTTKGFNQTNINGMTRANGTGKTLNDYCNAIKEVYREFDIPVIDWREHPIITPRSHAKWTWDGLHPNETGHQLIGRRIAEFMKVNV